MRTSPLPVYPPLVFTGDPDLFPAAVLTFQHQLFYAHSPQQITVIRVHIDVRFALSPGNIAVHADPHYPYDVVSKRELYIRLSLCLYSPGGSKMVAQIRLQALQHSGHRRLLRVHDTN